MNAEKKLRLENNELDKQLNKENDEIITDLVIYIQDKNLSAYNMQVVRREITAMAIESQMRGVSLKEVFGEDYRAFCDELVENSPKKSGYERLLDWVEIVATVCLVTLLVLFIPSLNKLKSEDIATLFSNFTVNGVTIVKGIILLAASLLIYKFIISLAFEKRKNAKRETVIVFVLIFLYFISDYIIALPIFTPLTLFGVTANFLVFFLPVLCVVLLAKLLHSNLMNKLAAQ